MLDGPPHPLPGELLRTKLAELLASRWEIPVTTVVAGPGFGKTTAVAQAVRLHRLNPCGVEAWVTCEPGDEDAQRLATAICHAFGVEPTAAPLASVLAALRATSATQSCLILDEVHELPAGSSGFLLLSDLVCRLPIGAHLVLVGRVVPPVPLARRYAAGAVLRIEQPELTFDAAELQVLAGRAGRGVADVAELGGWPALVRLTLSAPPGVARDYLWEEVVSALSDADRTALTCLSVLGSADSATLAELAGVPVDVCQLAERVPLVDRFGTDGLRAHPLWAAALDRLVSAGELRAMRVRAAGLLLRRNDPIRAGDLALAAHDRRLLDCAVTALVQSTISAFPHDTGARWLSEVTEEERDTPGLRLLDAATRQARSTGDPAVDELVDAAAKAAKTAGDLDTEVAALSLATAAAWSRSDDIRLFELFQRAVKVPDRDRSPVLRVLVATAQAILLEFEGRLEEAIAVMACLSEADLDSERSASAARLYVHLLMLAGRAEEAAALAGRRLTTSRFGSVRRLAQLARWLAGDPSELLLTAQRRRRTGGPIGPDPDAAARYHLPFLAFTIVIAASQGDGDTMATVGAQLDAAVPGGTVQEAAMLTVASAARAVCAHEEQAAVRSFEAFVARYPLTEPVASTHLRRFIAFGYVLSPAARSAWDTQPLGPCQERTREMSRILLAARQGVAVRRLPDAPTLVTAFPLPWTVELVAHAEAAGAPGVRTVLEWLTDRLGPVVREELRRLTTGTDAVSRAARRLLGQVPPQPMTRTRIEVLGPLRVFVEGRPVDRPELRRRRVRELLAVLVVLHDVERARLMDLLWPDLGPEPAARNLRVTLTYLRRILEPDRTAEGGGYYVRADRDRVRLVRSAALEVDLDELRAHLVSGDLHPALGLWRGDPLADLAGISALAPEKAQLTAELSAGALALGERTLAEGDTITARRCAELALAQDPYAEHFLRLLLAVELEGRDPKAVRRAIARVREALAGQGAPPDPATTLVLRHAEQVSSKALGNRSG
jgi:DNA-binding SARP family transcriptional activator